MLEKEKPSPHFGYEYTKRSAISGQVNQEQDTCSSFHQLNGMQNIIERPARPAWYNFSPDFLGNSITRIQETPIRTGFWFDPFEILHLTPSIFVVKTIMIQGLYKAVSIQCWY